MKNKTKKEIKKGLKKVDKVISPFIKLTLEDCYNLYEKEGICTTSTHCYMNGLQSIIEYTNAPMFYK